MDVFEAFMMRGSIRDYTGQAIPREDVEKVVDAGRLAATALNKQPWDIVAVTDKRMLTEITQAVEHAPFIAHASVCLCVFCQQCQHYLEDGCAATVQMLLAATALGLGSCWIAGHRREYSDRVRELLGAPPSHTLVSMITLGHPAQPARTFPKRGLEDVLHWETF